ncbi:MAG TPA: hypothetical protein VG406_08295 [Isosphaeraceae bacterium]|nr:hypothetical protein [Isosphaeraceae bacterium]
MDKPCRIPWWYFGLCGGVMLTALTAFKALWALPELLAEKSPLSELPLVALKVFAMGFVCGCLVSVLRDLPARLGLAGYAIVGIMTMNLFFLMCMLFFDQSFLTHNHSGAVFMFGLATVTGGVLGVWIGEDERKEAASREEPKGS